MAGIVQAVQSPTAGQTVLDSEVPKEGDRVPLHLCAGQIPRRGCEPLRVGGVPLPMTVVDTEAPRTLSRSERSTLLAQQLRYPMFRHAIGLRFTRQGVYS
jgi:hypothetical protein